MRLPQLPDRGRRTRRYGRTGAALPGRPEVAEEAFERYRYEHDHRTPVQQVRASELAVFMDEVSWYDLLDAGGNEIRVIDLESTHAPPLSEPATGRLADVLADSIAATEAH